MEHTTTAPAASPARRALSGVGTAFDWLVQRLRFMNEPQMAELQRQRGAGDGPESRRDEWR
ncbi:hypothetical protein [Phycicoccus flavus]|uniref:hypothetical protein n=1 Tax=Phycicoccus flavus TaxID=2502783 RepID=UPI000FEB5EA2|nr:hypothetical protein [Phycicoccus flavus]NHA68281.1 hypothetical protein [Phycicoccus flavus]